MKVSLFYAKNNNLVSKEIKWKYDIVLIKNNPNNLYVSNYPCAYFLIVLLKSSSYLYGNSILIIINIAC